MNGHFRHRGREINTFNGTLEFVSDPSQLDSFVKQPPPSYRGSTRGGSFNYNGGGSGLGYGGFVNNKFIDMNKPWVTQDIRNEIWKKVSLANTAKKSKKAEDVAALQNQAEYLDTQLRNAKIAWLARHPELEQEWLGVLAQEERSKTYFCDVCEKMVGTESEYKVHLSEHATCGIDGCGYTAHQDILEKHIMHQHLTGLYNRIAHGDSPEEIAKWREERKKNFPTKQKVEEKAVERAVLKERGEVMRLKREKLKKEERERRGDYEENKPEVEWECNCKARKFVENMRGRGRGRGRGMNFRVPKNVKHQSHCRELELIRERAKERREKRQSLWDEKKGKRKAIQEQDENTEPSVKKFRAEKVVSVEEDSCSEDEGWNGGLWKFPGTKQMATIKFEVDRYQSVPAITSNGGISNGTGREQTEFHGEIQKMKNSMALESIKSLDSSEDEAPEEIKTIVSYDNVVDESPDILQETKELKKQSKRKRRKDTEEKTRVETVQSSPLNDVSIYKDPVFPVEESVPEHWSDLPNVTSASSSHFQEVADTKQSSSHITKVISRPAVFEQRMRPPTLLEKLLLNEIKNERNKILQCVRFVCKNNFLQDSDSQSIEQIKS